MTMFDFPFYEPNIWTSLYCLLFYLFLLLLYHDKVSRLNNLEIKLKSSYKRNIVFLLAFFMITHCMKGDFYHYMDTIHNLIFISGYYNYGEDIYIHIGHLVNRNYLLFRTIVFGGSFLLFILSARRFSIHPFVSAIFLVLVYSNLFAYARATAAMSIYFFGLTFLCKPIKHNKIISYLFGLFVIFLSSYFHNSAIIMIVMTIVLLLPIRKWSIIIAFSLIPFVLSIFKKYYFYIAMSGNINSTISHKMINYSESEVDNGIAAIIINLFRDSSFYIPVLIILFTLLSSKAKNVPNELILFFKVTLGLVIVSIIFRLLGDNFAIIYYRVMFMAMIPLSIIILSLFKNRLLSLRSLNICMFCGISFNIAKYLYDLYIISH